MDQQWIVPGVPLLFDAIGSELLTDLFPASQVYQLFRFGPNTENENPAFQAIRDALVRDASAVVVPIEIDQEQDVPVRVFLHPSNKSPLKVVQHRVPAAHRGQNLDSSVVHIWMLHKSIG